MAPAMQFEGVETFTASRDRVYHLLVDLDALERSIPDLTSSKRIDEHTLEAVVRPGFSFLRGTMKLRIRIEDARPDESAAMKIDASGIGVSMKVTTHLVLHDEPSTDAGPQTKLEWRSEVSDLKGLVATVSPSLVRAAADQIIRNGWQQLHERLRRL